MRPPDDMGPGGRVAVANVEPAPIAAACLLPILEPAKIVVGRSGLGRIQIRVGFPFQRDPTILVGLRLSEVDARNGLADRLGGYFKGLLTATVHLIGGTTQVVHRSHLEIVGRPVDEAVHRHRRPRAAGGGPSIGVPPVGGLPVPVLVPGDGLAAVVGGRSPGQRHLLRRPPCAVRFVGAPGASAIGVAETSSSDPAPPFPRAVPSLAHGSGIPCRC